MTGVGKFGLTVMLLILCLPAAARLSRRSGQRFNLPGWIIQVCHRSVPGRGTQRRSGHHPNEPINALVEQPGKGEQGCGPAQPARMAAEGLTASALIPQFVADRPILISGPAFLCVFLI